MDIYARWIWLEYPLRHILRSCRHFSDRPFFIFGKRKKLRLYFTIALFAIVAMKLGHSEAYSNASNTYLWNSGGSHKKYNGSLYPVRGPENQRIQSLNKYRCCVTSRVSTLTKHREAFSSPVPLIFGGSLAWTIATVGCLTTCLATCSA